MSHFLEYNWEYSILNTLRKYIFQIIFRQKKDERIILNIFAPIIFDNLFFFLVE